MPRVAQWYTFSMVRAAKQKRVIGMVLVLGSTAMILGFLFFFDTRPERAIARSDDGLFEIEGDVPSSLFINIARDATASQKPWTAVVGSVYAVNPDGVELPAPVTVRLSAEDRAPTRTYAIGSFDAERGFWVPSDTRRDEKRDVFETRTRHFSQWALLQQPSVTLLGGEIDALVEDALRTVPPGANSYRVDTAYATVNGDFLLFEEGVRRGQCEGADTVREERVVTSLDGSATLVVDGVEIKGDVRAVVTWDVGTGCADLVTR